MDGLLGEPESITVSAWADLTSWKWGGAELFTLGDQFVIRLDDTAGHSGVHLSTGSTFVSATIDETFATTGWHFYAATFDDFTDTLKFYVDGEEVACESVSAINYEWVRGSNTLIGENVAWDGFDFSGTIDDMRVYDYALPAEQIKALHEMSEVTTNYDWDCNGNLKNVTDKLGHVTQYTYDELNRLTQTALIRTRTVQNQCTTVPSRNIRTMRSAG